MGSAAASRTLRKENEIGKVKLEIGQTRHRPGFSLQLSQQKLENKKLILVSASLRPRIGVLN
jgi:hypothetical protein